MESDIFDLKYSDYGDYGDYGDDCAISIAMNVARRLLQEEKVTASQIVGIGHALYAFQRLPVVTPGVYVRFGIVVHHKIESPSPKNPEDTVTLSDMEYIDFCISEDKFEISKGGSADCGVGHDSYSLAGWYVGLDGSRKTQCELHCIEDAISILLEQENTEISVEDYSDIDFFDKEELLPLNYHPLNQESKELLQQQPGGNPSEEELYILQLMDFGLESPQMSEKREEIRSKELMQKLEDKVMSLLDMTSEEAMIYLIKEHDLYTLGADDLIEGATEVLWEVIDMILLNLDCPTPDDKPPILFSDIVHKI